MYVNFENVEILYKWTLYQEPAKKSFEHFKESIKEKAQKIDNGNTDLNISPVFYKGKDTYYLLFLDIEQLTEPKKILKNINIDYYYAYTGRGLHIYACVCTNYKDVINNRSKLINMFYDKKYIDIITTLKVTPFRFMSAFSPKHNVWLHPMTKNDSLSYAVKHAKDKPSTLMHLDKYIEKVLSYFNKIEYMSYQKFEEIFDAIKENI